MTHYRITKQKIEIEECSRCLGSGRDFDFDPCVVKFEVGGESKGDPAGCWMCKGHGWSLNIYPSEVEIKEVMRAEL